MYTLILVFYFATGVYNGGASVATQEIQGFKSEESCTQEAQRNISKLAAPNIPRGNSGDVAVMMSNQVKWSCFKVY